MSHDPLCPYRPAQSGTCDRPFNDPNISCAVFHVSQPEISCQCDLLAKVRADERVKAVQECMETVNVIVWKYHNTHYHEHAEVARECQRSLRAVQVMP